MEVGFGRGVGRKGNGMMRERMKTEEKMRWNTMTLEFESRPCNKCVLDLEEKVFQVTVKDTGVGIENVEKAMEPMFTTCPELERSGMGFSFMEAFMDELEVRSHPGWGTEVVMKRKIGVHPEM